MAIVRNVQNDILYRYLGDNKYRNLSTGIDGIIKEDLAKKIFKINVEATEILNEYPLVEKLISSLNLKFDNNKNETK